MIVKGKSVFSGKIIFLCILIMPFLLLQLCRENLFVHVSVSSFFSISMKLDKDRHSIFLVSFDAIQQVQIYLSGMLCPEYLYQTVVIFIVYFVC